MPLSSLRNKKHACYMPKCLIFIFSSNWIFGAIDQIIVPRVLSEDNSCLMSALAPIWAVFVQWFVFIVRDAFFARFTKKCYIITFIFRF